ncbi:sorbosone dehydrogenase [Lysobacter arseniciresistens ZS79]|uniref:Sorbosone dehydrogenase n=1 Tax=Lysobacter arseniciresistens ZS79 TaxID=913325 RepID=A0A0A0EYB4_9GAMM|nr:sorbosone dehydrogenase family protein [Lysobacter arseniciresistens]KGM55931.1 sorbosone dehydrogenase [Lysobacter arseniciresistens ZS79]
MTALIIPVLLGLAGCLESAKLATIAGIGPNPTLPLPNRTLIPTVDIAPAEGWPSGAMPTPAPGFTVTRFAGGLDYPRWLYVLPNGDVLVAETNGPGKSGVTGLKGAVMKQVMKRAGAGVPSANRITLLRDADGDGVAETSSVFLQDLSSPFGMALVGDTLYVANADALVKVPYRAGDIAIAAVPEEVIELPGRGRFNHHWTKSLLASRDDSRLYVGVGSNSNAADNGMAVEVDRAAILEIDPAARTKRVFASGLRNPVGIAWHPLTGALWTVVNERDELGSDLVPDYLTSVREGGFYGWPYSYYGPHVDQEVQPQQPDLVARAIVPDYALGSHVAPLGLTFYDASLLAPRYRGGAFVGMHGSWNRRPPSGYKVVFVPFSNGRPAGAPEDVLTGFVGEDGHAFGRPVGVVVDKTGALLVADDVGNVVWRVVPVSTREDAGDSR